ncbi:unnamed protein product [Cyprideis torosa]|uniref:RNA helicase n=1 Tax=Cyprideis torosa TaxID=163714 RepID=A0A7R8WEG6_9CRUS|nr:unnamed protein product [Cyprideis torosa]CAG0889759.1 unnamed protein product [Cyprideis torosa]
MSIMNRFVNDIFILTQTKRLNDHDVSGLAMSFFPSTYSVPVTVTSLPTAVCWCGGWLVMDGRTDGCLMGKNKKRFNWKARENVKSVVIEKTGTQVSVENIGSEKYDEANPLVLPSKKRESKRVKDTNGKNVSSTKLLSEKQRKRLEKIVERKEKKAKDANISIIQFGIYAFVQRASLLEQLASVQTTSKLLDQLTSTSKMQTQGGKKRKMEKIRSLKGAKRRRSKVDSGLGEETASASCSMPSDPSVVGLEIEPPTSSESEHSEDEGDQPKDSAPTDDGKQLESTSPTPTNESAVEDSKTESPGQPKATEEDSNRANKTAPIDNIPTMFIPVHRSDEIQAARLKLPILMEEQAIMEAIRYNNVVILCGETGSGKTTQVPQFLFEAGYAERGVIGITEPRRVAAVSMAARVSQEMSLPQSEVSYQIRFEGTAGEKTKIKFMTDGVLLKEIQKVRETLPLLFYSLLKQMNLIEPMFCIGFRSGDFLLSKYSVIILDEAHERSMFTDVLVGLLSRILPIRNKKWKRSKDSSSASPLKLIVMSATLRVSDFSENPRLFKRSPPVVKVDSRQFPVSVHFNKRTPENYCDAAFKKVIKIHTQLPEGGVLVFLTAIHMNFAPTSLFPGQQEVLTLCRRLKAVFPERSPKSASRGWEKKPKDDINSVDFDTCRLSWKKVKLDDYSEDVSLMNLEGDEADLDVGEDAIADEEDPEDIEASAIVKALGGAGLRHPLHVLPLFSMLPPARQAEVFQAPPPGTRLCVVATNVAETSITIPHVKYVVDSGKVKTRLFDRVTGVSTFHVTWISKASANQRAGRAGRTSPGHCYRLYSSAIFNDTFDDFSLPEIQRRPVDDLLLQLKAMGIHKAVGFPFPSPPDIQQLKSAEEMLTLLGAIERFDAERLNGPISPLGQTMASFPVAPRYAKMLALAYQHKDLLPYVVAMVSAFSVPELLMEEGGVAARPEDRKRWQILRRKWARVGNSLALGDAVVLLRAVGAAEYFLSSKKGEEELTEFCDLNGLRPKAVKEIRKLRSQLTAEANILISQTHVNGKGGGEICVDPRMVPPTETQSRLLRQILLSGLVDHVARRVDPSELHTPEDKAQWNGAYRAANLVDPVFLHPASVLKKEAPEWVVYVEIVETSRLFARGIVGIEPEWLPKFAPALCHFSPPLTDPPPRYDSDSGKIMASFNVTYGKIYWELPVTELEFPQGLLRFKHFAKAFLDGQVCPSLAQYKKTLLSPPRVLLKTWAKVHHQRTESIVRALASAGVDCRDRLYEAWRSSDQFLLAEYCEWLPEGHRSLVSLSWPPDRAGDSGSDEADVSSSD